MRFIQERFHKASRSSVTRFPLVAAIVLIGVIFLTGIAFGATPKAGSSATKASASQDFGLEKGSKKLQAGFITVGPVSDWGFNYQHNQGRLEMEGQLRDKVHTALVENVAENADLQRVMQRMVGAGAKLIFSTSYGYADMCQRTAKKNPGTIFMQCLAPVSGSNAATYSANTWEPAYAAGVAAALTVTDSTKFGIVTSHPIPAVNWLLNAFTLGAQSINPNITVNVIFTNSWSDPAAEVEAVKSLASQRVRVVYVLVDTSIAGVQAAEKAGLYSISQHADLLSFAPKGYITGVVWNWGPLYVDVAEQVISGKWKAKPIAGGFKEGYVKLAPFGPKVNGDAQHKTREVIENIVSGKLAVFTGPIYDNSGTLRVPQGKSLGLNEILSMDWEAKGIQSSGKKK
jgi:basic membrane protein A